MDKNKSLQIGAAYIRVSTHMQEELSPDAQKRLLLDYAKSNDIVLPEEYIFLESGISGKKADKRPEFLRMISLAKQKPTPFSIILVWKFSRFARNQEESIVYKSLLRKQCGIDVISVSEPIVDGPFGSLIERIIEWMDEYYSVRLSSEVFRGMTEKAMKGGYQARPPLGYRIDRKGEPPVIVPEEARIIQFIFHSYIHDHMSIFEITRHLNTIGYKTSHNKPFECRSVEYILQNPTYCGMIRWNRVENETNRIKSQEEWIITQGQHEPIISKEVFEEAQKLRENTYHPKGSRPSATYRHWLSGLVKCPSCGRTMIAKSFVEKRTGKNYCYFTCYGHSKGKCTAKTSVSSRVLEPLVLSSIKDASENTATLSFEIKANRSPELNEQRQHLLNALAKIPDKEQRVKEAYRNGIDTLEEYKQNKELIQKERDALEAQLAACTSAKSETDDSINAAMIKRICGISDILQSDAFSDQQKNSALRSVVSRIIYQRATDIVDIFYYYS